jgi:predicted nucleic acid-binding protein
MSVFLRDCFADAAYWIGLVNKKDQYHARAQEWTLLIRGRITTTRAVLLESANTLARPAWRASCIDLFKQMQAKGVEVVPMDEGFWQRGWDLYQKRMDKTWSLTDCFSFLVMQDRGLTDALTTDDDFRQAGFRAVLLETPTATK